MFYFSFAEHFFVNRYSSIPYKIFLACLVFSEYSRNTKFTPQKNMTLESFESRSLVLCL